jgi:hypothetical protein
MVRFTAIRKLLSFAAVLLSAGVRAPAQVQGMQAFDNRVEGTNIHTNALQDFTLIAIHRNFQLFSQNANLHVRFFLPRLAGSPNRKVFVEASELQDSFHYFMQSKSTSKWNDGVWNVFEPWPTKDVIDRLGLYAGNVGVRAGYRIGNGPTVFLPVDVYQGDGQSATGTYTFHFITGSDLQSLDVLVTDSAGLAVKALDLQQKCNKAYNQGCKLYAAGSVHAFSLDMSALPQGEYHVRLLGHVPGSLTPTSLDVVLYHQHS